MHKIIIISGPTASGKTSTSIAIGEKLIENNIDAAIVNFDSLLFYKELSIGTAKPTKEEMSTVPHYLVDTCSAKTPINASDFVAKALETINKLHSENKVVILIGGSGFYLRALVKGMYESKHVDEKLREEINNQYKKDGISVFLDYLKEYDPESLLTLHENDHYRLLRAVEHHRMTGTKLSGEKKRMDKLRPYDLSVNDHPHWHMFHIYLDLPKEEHLKIIEKRTNQMIEDGLIDEVKGLLSSGFSGEEKPLASIGYKETLAYLNNEFETIEEYKERIVISTRQLAKSQRTFFKKVTPKSVFHPLDDKIEIIEKTLSFCKK